MTQIERTKIRELSPEDVEAVSGGGSLAAILGSAGGAQMDQYGTATSGAESVENTYALHLTSGPVVTVTNKASLR